MTTVVLNTATRKVEVFSSARDVQARAEIANHKAAADPHPQYLADADLAEVALSGDAGDLASGTVPDARMPNWTGYSVASRTALEAANVPAAVVGLRLLGHAAVGDGGGAHYKRVALEPAHPHKIQSADGAWWEELFAVDVTVSIPSDFATLQDAIDTLSKQPVRRGARIILNIETGHALTAGVYVENGDYGHFTITSTDATVPLAASFPDADSVVRGRNARMPVLDCLVDAGGKGFCGYEATFGSTGIVWGGVINAGVLANPGPSGTGLRVTHNSQVTASSSNFSGASRRCAWVTRGSTMIGDNANFSNAGGAALYVSRGSIVHANGANFSDSGSVNGAVRVARSIASIRQSTVDNSASVGIWAFEASVISARLCLIRNSTTHGVESFQGGATVDVNASTITGSGGNGVKAGSGGKVNVEHATVTGSTSDDLYVEDGSTIIAGDSATYSTTNQRANVLTGKGVIYDDREDSYPLAGSDANGRFIKHADGTMECYHVMKAEHAFDDTLRATWTFPGGGFTANDVYSWHANMQRRSPENVTEGIDNSKKRQCTIMEASHSALLIGVDLNAGSSLFTTGDFVWLSLSARGRWY